MSVSSFEILSVPVSDQERAKRFYRDILGTLILQWRQINN
jgi:catechol 2,3-dioxygenase-like lactoylglutathione lyase family enzyme